MKASLTDFQDTQAKWENPKSCGTDSISVALNRADVNLA